MNLEQSWAGTGDADRAQVSQCLHRIIRPMQVRDKLIPLKFPNELAPSIGKRPAADETMSHSCVDMATGKAQSQFHSSLEENKTHLEMHRGETNTYCRTPNMLKEISLPYHGKGTYQQLMSSSAFNTLTCQLDIRMGNNCPRSCKWMQGFCWETLNERSVKKVCHWLWLQRATTLGSTLR